MNTSELKKNATMSDIEIIETRTISEPVYSSEEEVIKSKPTMKKLVKKAPVPPPKKPVSEEDSDTEVDEPKTVKVLPVPQVTKVPPKTKIVEPTPEPEQSEEEREPEQEPREEREEPQQSEEEPEQEGEEKPEESEKEPEEEPEADSEEDKELLENLDATIEKAETQLKSKSKSDKPKGKYDSMSFKELQTLTKERKVAGRSVLKNRTLIIQKLEELDSQDQGEEINETKPTNKYESMTIPELKKLMGELNIVGRSACKNKGSMIEKLLAFDENPEEVSKAPKEKAPKEKAPKAKKEPKEPKEEDPIDEEVNKKVAELVNKLYKIKKHAKKQGSEFKNGFMDYINDLSTLVGDYEESCKSSQ